MAHTEFCNWLGQLLCHELRKSILIVLLFLLFYWIFPISLLSLEKLLTWPTLARHIYISFRINVCLCVCVCVRVCVCVTICIYKRYSKEGVSVKEYVCVSLIPTCVKERKSVRIYEGECGCVCIGKSVCERKREW